MSHKRTSGADEGGRAQRAQEIGLFRYALIRPVADPALTTRQRGPLVRELAEQEHLGPFGDRVRVSRVTLDRWIRAWRAGGFDALVPSARHAEPHTPASVLELAAALKREVPGRTAAQVAVILGEHAGWAPSARTLQRHFARLELNTRPDGTPPSAFGRFEAAAPNDRWTGDALHGPVVAGRKTYLFAFIDDHSRALTGYRWGHSEDTVRLEAALRNGMSARGIPRVVYLDNGSAMISKQLLRALAVLGIQLTHSKPRQPAGRGKIERVFRTVREQFLVELAAPGALAKIRDLTQLNELFTAWVETVYHQRIHSETGQTPLARFTTTDPPVLPTPAALHEAFLWSERRLVAKTATVSLHGNTYEVDAALVGRRVELVFDPFDLTDLQVRYQGRDMGVAIGHQIGRHVHPGAKPEASPDTAPPTGIDYLGLVRDRHTAALRVAPVNYSTLAQHAGDITKDVGTACITDPEASGGGGLDAVLEFELASFATLLSASRRTSNPEEVIPGQLDLLESLDPADTDNPQESP
jgi:putative transposase